MKNIFNNLGKPDLFFLLMTKAIKIRCFISIATQLIKEIIPFLKKKKLHYPICLNCYSKLWKTTTIQGWVEKINKCKVLKETDANKSNDKHYAFSTQKKKTKKR